ncbi:MAG TPA: hypothetical protein VNI54_13405 [Thermoanaerobaculia bacterium]|nr:hypothetical protein [Thermoanaerobaculia bacterium]
MEFKYNASALAAGGVIRSQHITTVIPSIASVALAPTGGEGKTVVSNYFSEELSFAHAETRVSGKRRGDKFITFTYVFIKNLRVFDKLAIGELRGTVTSIHSDRDRDGDGDDDHDFQLEASYRDVRAAGHEVVPELDVCVGSLKRYRHLSDVIKPRTAQALPPGLIAPADAQALAERFNTTSPAQLEKLVGERRALHGSLVERVDGRVTGKHHKVFVDKLGTVRFGELMFKPGRRSVSLLRINFGRNDTFAPLPENVQSFALENTESTSAPDDGSLTIASVEGNGTPIYP